MGAVARTIVYMEQGYVTAAFFRHCLYERYRQWEQERDLGRMLDEGMPFLPFIPLTNYMVCHTQSISADCVDRQLDTELA